MGMGKKQWSQEACVRTWLTESITDCPEGGSHRKFWGKRVEIRKLKDSSEGMSLASWQHTVYKGASGRN